MNQQTIDTLMVFFFGTRSGSFVLLGSPFVTLFLLSIWLGDKKRSESQRRGLFWTMGIAAGCWLGVVVWMFIALVDPWGIVWCLKLVIWMVFLGVIASWLLYPIVAILFYLASRGSDE